MKIFEALKKKLDRAAIAQRLRVVVDARKQAEAEADAGAERNAAAILEGQTLDPSVLNVGLKVEAARLSTEGLAALMPAAAAADLPAELTRIDKALQAHVDRRHAGLEVLAKALIAVARAGLALGLDVRDLRERPHLETFVGQALLGLGLGLNDHMPLLEACHREALRHAQWKTDRAPLEDASALIRRRGELGHRGAEILAVEALHAVGLNGTLEARVRELCQQARAVPVEPKPITKTVLGYQMVETGERPMLRKDGVGPALEAAKAECIEAAKAAGADAKVVELVKHGDGPVRIGEVVFIVE